MRPDQLFAKTTLLTVTAPLRSTPTLHLAPGATRHSDEAEPQQWQGGALPWPDQSVAHIDCVHLLETLTQDQGIALLRECRRVLRDDGSLHIVTADLTAILDALAAGDWRSLLDADAQEWIGQRAEAAHYLMTANGRRWLYDAAALQDAARLAGLHATAAPLAAGASLTMAFSGHKPALPARPLVSIVIPAYRVTYFKAALDSALQQTYTDTEILVLDDSADEAIRELIAATPGAGHVRYYRNTPRLGESRSLTRGIAEARGQLIKPLYDDDVILPDCVTRLVAAMQACPTATLASASRFTIDASGTRIAQQPMRLATADCLIDGLSLAGFTLATAGNFIGPPTATMFRRDDALSIPGCVMTFAGRFTNGAGDIATYLNLISRGDLAYLAEGLSEFRLHDNHTTSDPANRANEQRSWLYLQQHGRRLGLATAATALHIKRAL